MALFSRYGDYDAKGAKQLAEETGNTDGTCAGTRVQKQKGIVTYGVAPNRQNPFAGVAHAAIFNTWRRFSAQVLYVVPPFVAGYYIMNWATERFVYSHGRLFSKSGIKSMLTGA